MKGISVLFWGTYDKGKPRNRILIKGLLENGVSVRECHASIWEEVEDKSQIAGLGRRLHFFVKLISAYPVLLYRFLRSPRPDVVVVGYLGHLDILVLWLFAKLKRVPIVWDAFLSLYDTIVCDRRLLSKNNPLAMMVYCWEWLACRAARRIVLDTQAHADYFSRQYTVPGEKLGAVFVGAEPENFPVCSRTPKNAGDHLECLVLFYGQFIRLHGIETIIHAARLLAGTSIQFLIVGDGQESEKIAGMLRSHPLENVSWRQWIEYSELKRAIQNADICLGIFGKSEKASRVIPNKVFQILHSGKPLITRDSPAIRELLDPDMAGIYLVPPGSPEALADAIELARQALVQTPHDICLHSQVRVRITPHAVGGALYRILLEVADR
jgi:glycosyltransferase involved in cell wall biosynthesis